MSIGFAEIAIVIAVCLVTALVTLTGLAFWARRRRDTGKADHDGVLIRFHRGRMVEADPDFLLLLNHRGWDGSVEGLRPFFSFRFRGLTDQFPADGARSGGRYLSRQATDLTELNVATHKDTLTIALSAPGAPPDIIDHVRRYRRHSGWMTDLVAHSSPNPIWVTDQSEDVIWANRAYRQLVRDLGQDKDTETDRSILCGLDPMRSLPDREQRRYQLSFPGDRADAWIDVTVSEQDGALLHHAQNVTAVVQAEAAQRTFVQTLTKTFAQLSTGLAIFDRNRRLALFNPALVDLTGLSAEYLSSRPGYLSVFDRLRDSGIMPEPRSYASWRDKIFDLVAAAEDGRYQETWTLASGQTYRVTGRPHPNGAVAFLIEDISAEVMLTRRFREQLDMSQSVIESLDDAVAVFTPRGTLSFANVAYRDLWDLPEDEPMLDLSASEASRHWQDLCDPTPVWGDFRDFVAGRDQRAEWDAKVKLRNGQPLECRFRPLTGGASLAIFRAEPTPEAVQYRGTG